MGADAPTIVFIPVHRAPKKAPCPKCGKLGKRKRTCTREVRTVAFKAVAYLKITYGEYTARCECCTTFRNTPEGVLPKAHYDNKVRDLVLDRIIKDGMSIERILESLRREFLLELSSGFVYNVLRDRAEELDMSEHRRKVLEHFSGTLCVDELHLGRFTLLLATDPLSDLPVAFALVAANDQHHMPLTDRRAFLLEHNLDPEALTIALLPGSRAGEIERHLPTMLKAASLIRRSIPQTQFILPLASTAPAELVQSIISGEDRVGAGFNAAPPALRLKIIPGQAYQALGAAHAAVVASGTATVEAALAGVPTVIVYRVSPLTFAVARWLVRVPHVGMANLLAGERVFPGAHPGRFHPGASGARGLESHPGPGAHDGGAAGAGHGDPRAWGGRGPQAGPPRWRWN